MVIKKINSIEEFEKEISIIRDTDEFKYLKDVKSIIEIGTEHCSPCKMMLNIFESIKSDVIVYKVDAEEIPEIAEIFNVSSTPFIMFLSPNEQPIVNIGQIQTSFIESWIY